MILRAQRPIKEGLEVCISYISIMQGKKISLYTLENHLSLPNFKKDPIKFTKLVKIFVDGSFQIYVKSYTNA